MNLQIRNDFLGLNNNEKKNNIEKGNNFKISIKCGDVRVGEMVQ